MNAANPTPGQCARAGDIERVGRAGPSGRTGAAGWARRLAMTGLLLGFTLGLCACFTAPPSGATVVRPFELNRYLGQWYEIARLDHRFERGLSRVTAGYRMRPDGAVEVVNRGFDAAQGVWKEAVGRAYFTGNPDTASLKVSFFGPFYGGYHVVALDPDYQWSMVMGPNTDYLWILARQPVLAPAVREALLKQAAALGVDVGDIIWVEHAPAGG